MSTSTRPEVEDAISLIINHLTARMRTLVQTPSETRS